MIPAEPCDDFEPSGQPEKALFNGKDASNKQKLPTTARGESDSLVLGREVWRFSAISKMGRCLHSGDQKALDYFEENGTGIYSTWRTAAGSIGKQIAKIGSVPPWVNYSDLSEKLLQKLEEKLGRP